MKIKPQILTAMILLATIGGLVMFIAPEYIEVIGVACVVGISNLGMRLLENED